MTDLDAHLFLVLHRTLSPWVLPMALFSAIGGGWGALTLFPLIYARRTRLLAQSLALVLATQAIVVFSLKRAFGRVRPCFSLTGIEASVFSPPRDFSFPSGHAAGSFAFAIFVATVLIKSTPINATPRERLLRQGGAGLLVALAVGVGLSRIALGVHFPGDVMAGALIGGAIAYGGAHLHLRRALAISSTTHLTERRAHPADKS